MFKIFHNCYGRQAFESHEQAMETPMKIYAQENAEPTVATARQFGDIKAKACRNCGKWHLWPHSN